MNPQRTHKTSFSVLVIDENEASRKMIAEVFSKKFEVESTDQSIQGLEKARKNVFEAIFLSTSTAILSGMDAASLLKQDSKTRHIPIVLIAQTNDDLTRLRAQKLGISDVITRPLEIQSIQNMFQNLAKKVLHSSQQEEILYKNMKLVSALKTVETMGQKIKLTRTEYELLRLFVSNPNLILERPLILRSIWKEDAEQIKSRTIDVHLRALRKKLPSLGQAIQSVYGMGYRLDHDAVLETSEISTSATNQDELKILEKDEKEAA